MPSSDVVVIGGGILGVCATYFLARAGASVTLLEAHEPGAGASGGSFAWINATSKEPRSYHDLNRRGIEAYGRLAEELRVEAPPSAAISARPHPASSDALGLHSGGSLHLAVGAAEQAVLRSRCEELRAWRYPVAWLDAAATRALEPDLRSTGSDVAGMHAEMDCWVDPPRLLAALLSAARRAGARIMTGVAATGVLQEGGRVRGVTTAGEEFSAGTVLLAAGTGVPALAALAGVTVPVERVPGLLALTSAVTSGGPRRVIYAPGVHARPAPGNRSLLAAGDLDDRTREDTTVDPLPTWADVLRERLARWYPTLGDARIESAHVCVRPMPADGFPIVGAAPAVRGLYVAVTHSGITLGPLLGEWIAREILTGERLPLLAAYRPERFAADVCASGPDGLRTRKREKGENAKGG